MEVDFVSNNVRGEVKKRLIHQLERFFANEQHLRLYKLYLKKRLGRTFEWLCTQADPKTPVPHGLPIPIPLLHFLYKQQLDFYHKRFFDPTNRNHGLGNRLRLRHKKHGIESEGTIGCLQFIRWAYNLNLIDYCLRHQRLLTKLRQSTMPKDSGNSRGDHVIKRRSRIECA